MHIPVVFINGQLKHGLNEHVPLTSTSDENQQEMR